MIRRLKNGFTLTEILVTVAIIGILASVVTVSTTSARQKARDNKRKADLEIIASALELYYIDNKRYPKQETPVSVENIADEIQDYISDIPEDSKDNDYTYQSDGIKFYLDAQLERREDADIEASEYKTGIYNKDGKSYYRVSSS